MANMHIDPFPSANYKKQVGILSSCPAQREERSLEMRLVGIKGGLTNTLSWNHVWWSATHNNCYRNFLLHEDQLSSQSKLQYVCHLHIPDVGRACENKTQLRANQRLDYRVTIVTHPLLIRETAFCSSNFRTWWEKVDSYLSNKW